METLVKIVQVLQLSFEGFGWNLCHLSLASEDLCKIHERSLAFYSLENEDKKMDWISAHCLSLNNEP